MHSGVLFFPGVGSTLAWGVAHVKQSPLGGALHERELAVATLTSTQGICPALRDTWPALSPDRELTLVALKVIQQAI